MEQQLTGKVTIVTGSAQGIGKAVALRLAHEGADLIVADINTKKAEQTAKEIKAFGRRAMAYPMNLANVEQIQPMVDKVVGASVVSSPDAPDVVIAKRIRLLDPFLGVRNI